MLGTSPDVESVARLLLLVSVRLALAMTAIVVVERAVSALVRARRDYIEHRYRPFVRGALAGADAAVGRLVAAPTRHHLGIARLLVEPLIDDRDPARIARTRAIVIALSIVPIADRYLRSWLWWRRAVALRALGVLQLHDHTAAVIAALDDPHPDVRAAALDALTYMHDVASLRGVVVRLHDASLHPARRLAAVAAFGPECEEFLLELSEVDAAHLANYAHALAMCGTSRSRPALARWTHDARSEVRAAAFEALAHVGLDADVASLAVAALESTDDAVRAMAAYALKGWTGSGDAAVHLARHLDDAWPVAVRAAQSLRSMGNAGVFELQAQASRSDLAGLLARQMLSPMGARC
jgi:HEAT repeat protein